VPEIDRQGDGVGPAGRITAFPDQIQSLRKRGEEAAVGLLVAGCTGLMASVTPCADRCRQHGIDGLGQQPMGMGAGVPTAAPAVQHDDRCGQHAGAFDCVQGIGHAFGECAAVAAGEAPRPLDVAAATPALESMAATVAGDIGFRPPHRQGVEAGGAAAGNLECHVPAGRGELAEGG